MNELVDQTIFAGDPGGRLGNCLPACVATYLGVSLGEVPHFIEWGDRYNPDPDEPDTGRWWCMFLGYMAGHGLWPVELEAVDQGEPGEVLFVMGMSPRGVCHQVLYRDSALFHDPHPDKSGITDVREVIAWRPMLHDHTPTEAPA